MINSTLGNSALPYIILFLAIVISFSCSSTNDRNYLNEDIILFEDTLSLETLKGEQVALDGLYAGRMDVCDSLLFMQDFKYPGYFISVFNHYTGRHLGNFMPKGNGPDEYLDLSWIYQFFYEDGHLKGLIYYFLREKIIIWDITESLRTGSTCTELIDISKSEPKGALGGYMFFTNTKQLMARIRNNQPTDNQMFHKIDCDAQEIKQVYSLYNKPIDNDDSVFRILYHHIPWAHNVIGSKLASGMAIIHQINILDIETGIQKGFRLKQTPGLGDVAGSRQDMQFHYLGIAADTQYIYALYVGETTDLKAGFPKGRIVHVFNWNGELVRKLYLDQEAGHIGIDAQSHALMIKNDDTDEIYRYCLK